MKITITWFIFLMALTVTGASTYRSCYIIHDPIEREDKVFEGEEKGIVRRSQQ